MHNFKSLTNSTYLKLKIEVALVFRSLAVFVKSTILAGFISTAAYSQDASGPYLAARQAAVNHNYGVASDYFSRALEQSPENKSIIDQAMFTFLAAGEVNKAHALTELLNNNSENPTLIRALKITHAFKTGNYKGAIDQLAVDGVAGPAVDGLLKGWALMGLGEVSDALEAFDAASKSQGMQSFSIYQKALALASVGDFESAGIILEVKGSAPVILSPRGRQAYAQILVQLERQQDAVTFLTKIYDDTDDEEVRALISRIKAGAAIDFDIITNASEGAGEVFLFLALALQDGESQDGLLLYTRLASYLAPQNINAVLLSAQLLEELKNYDLAIASYDSVPRSHPAFVKAELGRAQALAYIGKTETAIEVLTQLSESFSSVRSVHDALGNLLRQDGQFDDAIKAYDVAIDIIKTPEAKHWYNFYVRAIAHERAGDWASAMRDFDYALELSPNQFQVLNYLGYSLVERGERLEEALSMIELAVAAQPKAGYIIDSLGWVQYKLGYYNEAVSQLERAAELMATDPIVNDHLGDSYWAVGRKIEARFQWRRALSFITKDTELGDIDPSRVREKLDIGLDAVLLKEDRLPLKVADDD
jgi:tetratricopeptide (TPR) repeat protein